MTTQGRGSAARDQDMTIDKTMRMKGDLKVGMGGQFAERTAKFNAAPLEGKDLVKWKYQTYMKDYLRCIWAVDESVGKVLDYLRGIRIRRKHDCYVLLRSGVLHG